jgi:hypothetical protein
MIGNRAAQQGQMGMASAGMRGRQEEMMGQEGAGEASEQEGNAPPEEQAVYKKFMENYLKIMYDAGPQKGPKGEPSLLDDVMKMLKDVQDPVFSLGAAAETIVGHLADSAEQAGKPIPPDVLLHATNNEVIPDLAELSENSGIHDYTPEEMAGALQVGVSLYMEERKDRIDIEAFKADMQMLQQAEQSGTLEDVVPGITEMASQAPAAPPEAPPPEPGQPASIAGARPMPGRGRV